jgi:hypothetical protein
MAISHFKIPTGLEVRVATTITGKVDINGALTASSGLSSSRGDYTSLFINNVAVTTGGVGAAEVSGAITGALASYDSNVSGAITSSLSGYATLVGVSGTFATYAEVSGAITASLADIPTRSEVSGVLTASYAQLGVTNTFTAAQVITGGLSMTGDLSARSASLGGDLIVAGNLTVQGTTTYIDSTTVNIGDKNINIGTGSTDLAVLDGGGLDLGTGAEVQWRYSSGSNAWTSNVGLSSSVDLKAPTALVTALTGTTTTGSFATFTNITGSFVSGSQAQFTQLTGALSSSAIIVNDIAAVSYGSFPLNTIAGVVAGGTGSLPVFATARAGAVKYILNASASSGNHHALEVLVTHSGSTPFYTSYASLYTGVPMIRVTASIANLPIVGNVVTVGAENISGETINVGYLTHYIF